MEAQFKPDAYARRSGSAGIFLTLTPNDVEKLKSLYITLRKCDCRHAEEMDIIAIPLLELLIAEAVGILT